MNSIDQPPEVLEALKQFCLRPTGFLLLSGKNGTGKSYAAMTIYNHQTPYRIPDRDDDAAIFINQSELNMEWSSRMKTPKYLLNKYTKTKFLVLDDIGTRTPTEAFMDFLYAVADERYNRRDHLGTIITTNLTSIAIREKFGDAFFSRVASGIRFKLDGDDRRFNASNSRFNGPSLRDL